MKVPPSHPPLKGNHFRVSRPFSCNEFKISPPPIPQEYSNYPRVIGSNFLSCQGGTHSPSQKHPNLKFSHTCPYRITLPPPDNGQNGIDFYVFLFFFAFKISIKSKFLLRICRILTIFAIMG